MNSLPQKKDSSLKTKFSKWQFWCDRGGTFTDIVGISPEGDISTEKILSSNPNQYQDSTVEGIRRILKLGESEEIPEDLIGKIRIGTTIGTNALLEGKGSSTVLITTRGFKDALRIGYQNRPDLFALKINPKKSLYEEVITVDERLDATGRVIRNINIHQLKKRLIRMVQKGIDSAAIVFMHSYVNPVHELIVERIAKEVGFCNVSLSHKIAKTIKFVARGETTTVDAYLTPTLQQYISKLSEAFGNIPLQFMQSHGGLVAASHFKGKNCVLSGPAGGVVGAVRTAEKNGIERIIGFDMGGTSTDVSHYAGRFERISENEINGYKLNIPMMAINTVAAGGGSIVGYDGIRMRVGPDSAGSDPGPACYQKGGPLTITDCNVLLGKIQPQYFPKSFGNTNDKAIDTDLVHNAFLKLTEQINRDAFSAYSVEQIAEGFLKIAVAKMANAIETISIQKGIDLRSYSLNCFGGAAGQHACQVADSLGIKSIYVDKNASLLSAIGMGYAETRIINEETVNAKLIYQNLNQLRDRIQSIKEEISYKLQNQGIQRGDLSISVNYKLRYLGTDDSLEIEENDFKSMKIEFEKQHLRRYGFIEENTDVIVASLIVEGVGLDASDLKDLETDDRKQKDRPDPIEKHDVFLEGQRISLSFYDGDMLKPGIVLAGPLVVITKTNTLVVESSWDIKVMKNHAFVLRKISETDKRSVGNESTEVELFSNQIMSIAEQMGVAFQKTASSVNIKERLDLSCAVFDNNGCLLANAPHIPVHLGSMSESVKSVIEQFSLKIKPGDVYITNDPFSGGTHLPDITVISPVFSTENKKPLFFVGSRGHHADIGGITPGSMPAASTTIEEEGVLLKNKRIVRNGKFEESHIRDVLRRHKYPARNIKNNIADIRAALAANRRGIDELSELSLNYGPVKTQNYIDKVKIQGEQAVSELIKSLDSGSCEKILDGGEKIKVSISVNKAAPSITIDFEGTSKQTNNNLNAPSSITQACVLYVLRTLVKKEIPLNEGCLRPVKLNIPRGSMLNPVHPAAVVAGNVETSQNIVDCLYGAFGIMAASQGTMNNVTFGNERHQYYETLCGGTGAGANFHGCDAVHCHMTNSRLTDPEVLEVRFPVTLSEFSIRADSGGNGRFKGGRGVIRKIKFLEEMVVSILSSHRSKGPSGINGGSSGLAGRNRILTNDNKIIRLRGIDQMKVENGDVLWVETPGGGGYGTAE